MEEEYSSTTESRQGNHTEIVTVSIDSYRIEEGLVKKHVSYIITGQDSSGVFSTIRRYKEFQCLRSVLIMNWPSIPIPALPKKKVVGNLNKDLIHKRKKLLDYFIGKVVSHYFIYKSDAFQLFIKGPADYVKSSKGIKVFTFEEILNNLKSNLPHSESFQVTTSHIEAIDGLYSILEEALNRIKIFKKSCKKLTLSFYRYEDGLCTLTSNFTQICQYFYPNKEPLNILQKKATNPYKILLDWARRESVELESLMKCLEKRSYLESILAKSQARRDKHQHDLENFQSGKKSLMQKLKKKPDEETLKQLEGQVSENDKEIAALQELIRVITDRIVNFTIESLKTKESEKLESTIRCFSGVIVNEYKEYIDYFHGVMRSINPEIEIY